MFLWTDCIVIFFNWYLLHIKLNSHYQAWSYKEAKKTKMKNLLESQPKVKT